MAKHEINIYENKTLSKTVAPYLGTYVTKRDVDMKELCERASQLSGLPAIQLEGMILGAINAAAEMQKESIVKMNFDGFCVIAQITGKFATADAEFGPGNKLLLAIRLDSDIRNCLVNVTPTIVTEETTTKLRVLDVQDVAEPKPYGIIHGMHPFLIFGVNMVLTDEGATVFVEDSRGITYDVVVDEIVKEKQIIRAHTAALLEAGDYKVIVKTRAGEPDGQLQKDFRKVKYLHVADPKRITIERCDCYTDSEFAAIGDNFDGATGYRVEGGKRYVKGKFQVLEDPEVEIELWQDEDTDEPRIWHSNDTGEAPSGAAFTFKLTADPAKPDFVQETVTYEGTVS